MSLPFGYRQNGTLWIYGDSVARLLMKSVRSRLLCQRLYTQCLLSYNWIYPVGENNTGMYEQDDLDFRPGRVIGEVLTVLEHPLMQGEENVLLLNLGLHYAHAINFTTFRRLIGDLILRFKEKELDPQGKSVSKYKAKIIWKTTTFLHKEKQGNSGDITRFRFHTPQVYVVNQ